jgi:hypothetical protein
MVREGIMGREEGYLKIYGKQPEHLLDIARNRLAE